MRPIAKLYGLIFAFALFNASPVAATTYAVSGSAGGLSFDGLVTTNGTNGVLQEQDILGWTMKVTGTGGASYSFSNVIGLLTFEGSGLSATPSGLFWNWDANPGFLGFEDGAFPNPYARIFFSNDGLPPKELFIVLSTGDGANDYEDGRRSGFRVEQIGVVGETPLPGAAILFASALGMTGLVARHRQRRLRKLLA